MTNETTDDRSSELTRERMMHLRKLLREARVEGTRRMTGNELEQKAIELGLEQPTEPEPEPAQPEPEQTPEVPESQVPSIFDAKPQKPAKNASKEAENVKKQPKTDQNGPKAQVSDLTKAIESAILGTLSNQQPALDEQKIIELVKKHSTTPLSIQVRSAKREHVKIDGVHEITPSVLELIDIYEKPYLVGPAGSGKTTIAKHCAQALDMPFYCHGAVLQPYELLGFIDASGKYHRTQLRDAFENGGVLLLDEADGSSPQALLTMNAALSNGFMAFPDGLIEAHPDFIPIVAANTIGLGASPQYVGRNPLDAATIDRFTQISVNYDHKLENLLAMSSFEEFNVGKETTESDRALISEWISTVRNYRKAVDKQQIKIVLSPRKTIAGAKMLTRKGHNLKTVIKAVLEPLLTKDQQKRVREAVKAL